MEITFDLIPRRLLFTLSEPRLRTEATVEHVTTQWQGRRVLVTGCTGLLGTAVSRELLARGADVVGLVRDRSRAAHYTREVAENRFHIVHGVVEDAIRLHTAMAVHDVSAVFHLANDSDRGLDAVIRAATIHDPRMPVITARPLLQFRIARTSSPSIALGVARFGELFGADRKTSRVIPRTALALLTGSPASAASSALRDFVFAPDAARACLAMAETMEAEGHSLDLAFRAGWEMTESTMAECVADVFAGRAAAMNAQPVANPLDWTPHDTLTESIAITIDWYRANQRALTAAPSRPQRKAA